MEAKQLAESAEILLRDFQQSLDEADSQVLLERLIQEHVRPVARQVLNSTLRFRLTDQQCGISHPDGEDVYSNIVVALCQRLRRLKDESREPTINNFRGYVAVTSYNACHEYLRQKFPQRWSLANKVRYLLTHRREFALWEDDERCSFAGFVAWLNCKPSVSDRERVRQWCESVAGITQLKQGQTHNPRADPTASLRAIFERLGEPVELNQLISLVAELWGVSEHSVQSLDEEHSLKQKLYDPQPLHDTRIELQFSLRDLWVEVAQLPPRQRASLLLNLRDADGRDIITLIPYTRTATIRQIAAALEIPFKRFAQLWNELPLEDAEIAAQLGITRQQVINLRKCARERLARRMKAGRT
jgi:DNA-directed RNA polymerase specialized sigma24 family protein